MGTKKNLIKTGKCIWCGKSVPDVTFTARPHILPQKLGGEEIGTDVCDDCNHYFGKATKGISAVDVAFKEIFNAFRTFVCIRTETLSPDSTMKSPFIF